MLVLRTCTSDMTSYGGFRWKEKGVVKAPDWNDSPCCGHGLHGLPWGEGAGNLMRWDADAKWLVVEVADKHVIDLGGKVKFPRGKVVFCGDRHGATQYLLANGGAGKAIAGLDLIVGDNQAATVGYRGTATAGNYGTATAGYRGTATAGNYGTATAGEGGTATAGNYGTATAGNYGTATAGYRGTATAGEGGILEISWYDENRDRFRRTIGYIGEDAIVDGRYARLEPNAKYRLNELGQFVPIEKQAGDGTGNLTLYVWKDNQWVPLTDCAITNCCP